MYKKLKKGFTIVELVIVIAVIGILSAVLIPTFSGLINKANLAADGALVRELNNAITLDAEVNGKHETIHDALKATDEYGFNVQRINAKASQNKILWDSKNDVFCYLKDGNVEYIAASVEQGKELSAGDYRLWIISNNVDAEYSTYLYKYTGNGTITTSKGLDVGNEEVSSITYSHTGAVQDVVIRTNSFSTTLTINAAADTVKHYGNAAIVDVEKIASASYHEKGIVGRLTVEQGHAVAESESIIFCFIDAGTNSSATAEVKSGAVVYDSNGQNNGLEAVVEGQHDDCGAGHHHFGSQLVIDNKVYEVCKSCGYTLVTVVDLAGNESKTTMVDETGEIITTPIETYNSTATNESGQVVENKEEPIVETPTVSEKKDETCVHEFVSTISLEATCTHTGIRTYTCTKCGMSYTSIVPLKAHSYYDNIGGVHSSTEHCAVCGHERGEYVAQIGDIKYTTLTDAIAAVPTDGTQTLITLINDEAIEGNAGWIIAANQNVVLDLNGYTLKNLVTEDKGSQVITNKGLLVIKDSSDSNKDGTGTGMIFNQAKDGANLGTWPTYNYVTNIITNTGNLTIQSGYLYMAKGSSISYCIDSQTNGNNQEPVVTINGGKLYNYYTNAVRMFCNSTTKFNTMIVNDGNISGYGGSIWVQGSNKNNNKFSLTINGGVFTTTAKAVVNGTSDLCVASGAAINFQVYASGNSGSNYSADSILKITGGTFNENVQTYIYSGNYALEGGTLPQLEITGGTFNGYVYTNGQNAIVTGGTFKFYDYNNGTTTLSDMLESNMFADGYHATDVSNGYFTVIED